LDVWLGDETKYIERSNLFDEITKQNNKKNTINKEDIYTVGL